MIKQVENLSLKLINSLYQSLINNNVCILLARKALSRDTKYQKINFNLNSKVKFS